MIEIRVGHLADRLGVHRNTVTNWIRSGKLRATATVGKKYLIEKAALLRDQIRELKRHLEGSSPISGAPAQPAKPVRYASPGKKRSRGRQRQPL